MDAHTLQAFLTVAETGSFSLAAEQLYLTQPAVSKRIAALEDELTVKLFERLSKRILLTEAGRVLLPRARNIVQEMAGCKQMMADLSGEVSGVLQIATSHHIGLHRLPNCLRNYSVLYPKVEFALKFLDSESGCLAVADGLVEMAVVTLPQRQPEKLQICKIWDDPLQVMVGKTHPLAELAVMETLERYPAIVPEKGSETRRLIESSLAAAGISLRTRIETNYLETIRMLVASGLGWSVLPVIMLNDDLHCVRIPGLSFERSLGVVQRAGGELSRAARKFSEMLIEPRL